MNIELSKCVSNFLVGEHPRMGALDVCPFIPVQNVSMEECVECAKEFGEKLAMELGVPGISGSVIREFPLCCLNRCDAL